MMAEEPFHLYKAAQLHKGRKVLLVFCITPRRFVFHLSRELQYKPSFHICCKQFSHVISPLISTSPIWFRLILFFMFLLVRSRLSTKQGMKLKSRFKLDPFLLSCNLNAGRRFKIRYPWFVNITVYSKLVNTH